MRQWVRNDAITIHPGCALMHPSHTKIDASGALQYVYKMCWKVILTMGKNVSRVYLAVDTELSVWA